jgi:hypothetical protein
MHRALAAEVGALARETGMSRSAVIRFLVYRGLERLDGPEPIFFLGARTS